MMICWRLTDGSESGLRVDERAADGVLTEMRRKYPAVTFWMEVPCG